MRWWQCLGCWSLGAGRQASRQRCWQQKNSLKMTVIPMSFFKFSLQKKMALWRSWKNQLSLVLMLQFWSIWRGTGPPSDWGASGCRGSALSPGHQGFQLEIWLSVSELPSHTHWCWEVGEGSKVFLVWGMEIWMWIGKCMFLVGHNAGHDPQRLDSTVNSMPR